MGVAFRVSTLFVCLMVEGFAQAPATPAPDSTKPQSPQPVTVTPKPLSATARRIRELSKTSPGGFVGSDVCRVCHNDQWQDFYKNPHYTTMATARPDPRTTGCESCHGPSQAHVEAEGGRGNVFAFSIAGPKPILDNCLTCHSKTLTRANIRRSSHSLADIVCTSCHSIHKSATPKFLLARQQKDLCYGCHTDVRAQFNMPHKHRVNEGFMQCTDCHNPHGAFAPTWRSGVRPRMVRQALGNEQACMQCHVDKRGPFLYEHGGVRIDGCETCHNPHGSTNPRLLRRPAVWLQCLECHTGVESFGRQRDGVDRQSPSHNMADPRYQNCTACHVRIHGSNSDPRFLR